MIGLGRATYKAFGPRALKIPWIGFDRTKGSKPQMARIIGVSFWTNPGASSAIPSKDKIKGAKPSMAGRVYSFFRAGTLESTGTSIISSIMTKVKEASILIPRGILQRHFYKYSSHLSLTLLT